MELGQEARLWRVICVRYHIFDLLLLSELKDCELTTLADYGLLSGLIRAVQGHSWQVRDAEIEMGAPADSKGNLLLHVTLAVVHLVVADLEVSTGCALPTAVETSSDFPTRL